MALRDLVFSDLCVTDQIATSWRKVYSDSLNAEAISPEFAQELTQLYQRLSGHKGGRHFGIEWDGIRLRATRLNVSDSKIVYVCRRHVVVSKSIVDLGIPPALASRLLDAKLKEGLVCFFGTTGAGKTTTASRFCIDKLLHGGGVCWTVENPIEIEMEGRHGNGICYQTEVDNDSDIGPAINDLYRATPNIIFIGELRDGAAIREAVSAGASGRLVVFTYHAHDLATGLARMARHMAGDNDALCALSDALRMGIHLKLKTSIRMPLPGQAGMPESRSTLITEALCVDDGVSGEAIRSIIRKGEFPLLGSEIERQRRNLMGQKL